MARRELGRRYRRILVDEFQDTDPVQAEVLLLLASEPAGEVREDDPPEWTGAVPRPGQLFVVGDPKQSIYRFRRADIAVYDQDKAAAEIARVCRPGGKIGLANWTPESFIGRLFKTIGQFVPPAPGVKSPALWGTKARLEELLGRSAKAKIRTSATSSRTARPKARSARPAMRC